MAAVYIFSEHIRDLVLEGKQELEVAEDARISAAAWDLIKEKKVTVRFQPAGPRGAPGQAGQAERNGAVVADSAEKKASAGGADETGTGKKTPPPVAEEPAPAQTSLREAPSEEDIETIVNRVIARLREARGEKNETATAPAAQTVEDDDLVICRCEEITKGEIREAIRNGMGTLSGIKRVTRAGMGLCQGQTCQELVSRILAEELGIRPGELDPLTARSPVRPLRLETFARS